MSETFDHVHPQHHGPNTVHMTRVRIAEIILAAGHRRVLDLPCGTGALTRILLDGGLEVVPADLNPAGFIVPDRSCLYANLNERLPFEDGAFDAMACIEGVEHIENPHLLAREANRILRTGGRLYVSTPTCCRSDRV
jgi:2-polyprenyl-3-methyl-5-hydroxy-6-metoxy-1,4-benzoquinol methylase